MESLHAICESTRADGENDITAMIYLNLHLEEVKHLSFTSLKEVGKKNSGHQARRIGAE